MNKIFPLARNKNIVIQELEKELLLYDLEKNKALCLNETSALVWQLCDGKNSVSEVGAIISEKLAVSVPEELVWLALEQLKLEDLLENAAQIPGKFDRLNRREIVKKVGLASLVAFPVIASVIAPSAVMAQSGGLAAGTSCSSNNQCASDNCSSFSPSVCCVGAGGLQPGTFVGCENPLFGPMCNSLNVTCCSGSAGSSAQFSFLCFASPPLGACECR